QTCALPIYVRLFSRKIEVRRIEQLVGRCNRFASFTVVCATKRNHSLYSARCSDCKEQHNMIFLWAFLVGCAICVVGQIMFDVFKLTPAHTLTILVIVGAILGGLNLYEPLVDFAGAGATVPITSFGNSLVQGALREAEQHGLIGVVTGIFEV